jgi:hypothetical protein
LGLHRAELPPPAPAVSIPAECRVEPVTPEAVEEPQLPALPAASTPNYLAARTQRAERAGLYFQQRSQAIQFAFDTNIAAQRACKNGLDGQ